MSTNKPWDRPWSMDEIIENSDKWNLAGDVALLNTLKSFADNLLKKTNEINNNLLNLTNNLDETNLQLNIAQNEFQNLRNTQFIESRVYEDDESLPKSDEKAKIEETSEDHSDDIRAAAVKGLEVLEEFFEKVEVSVSDSEDEDIDLPNYILRPKDLYIDRPLPYIIGSEEWHKNWHVGLEDSSDSETEKVSNFSESDSESDLPIIQDRSQIKDTSDTSSDFSEKIESKIGKNEFYSSGSENSVPVSNQNFAEQLAAKLGHVIKDFEEPEINRRPIQTKTSNYGDVFFDEPPPLDEPKGMFSGGRGLFDDDDEDISYSTPKDSKIETPKSKSDLFDEEDIFAKTNPQNIQKPPLFSEEPPALDEKKKPVGGVSIFGGGNVFDKKLLKKQASSDDEYEKEKKKIDLFSDDLFENSPEKVNVQGTKIVKKVNLFDSDEEDTKNLFEDKKKQEVKKETEPVKKIGLFEDDDDLFKDDLFSSESTKKFTSKLFEDIPGDELFSTNFEEKPKSTALFDDLVSIPHKNSINNDSKADKILTESTVEVTSDENKPFSSSPNENSDKNEKNIMEPPIPKPRLTLFDSPPPDPDDLFGTAKTASDLFDAMSLSSSASKTDFVSSDLFDSSPDLFVKCPPETSTPTPQATPIPNLRLFDPSPPPDDVWDAKSDVSENDDFINDFEDMKTEDSDLFSEEPPSLDFKEETNLKKPGKLKHNLNINVGALMPGYIPPKRVDGAEKSSRDETSDDVTKTSDSVNVDKLRDSVKSLDQTDKLEVLQSVTKDRVKVPLNRRPSTRKGRKEALRRSISDFKLEQDQLGNSDENEIPQDSPVKSKNELIIENIPIVSEKESSLLESEDVFGKFVEKPKAAAIPPNIEKEEKMFETLKPESQSQSKSTVFDDDNQHFGKYVQESKVANLTAANPPKVKEEMFFETSKPKAQSQSKKTLFDDDDEDDLFSKKTMQPTKTKKSLFDDDDDDDIFKSFSTANVKKAGTKMATEKKIPKVTSVKKLENTKPDDDPLSALLK